MKGTIGERVAQEVTERMVSRDMSQTKIAMFVAYTLESEEIVSRQYYGLPISVSDHAEWVRTLLDNFFEFDVLPACHKRQEVPRPEKVRYMVFFPGDYIPGLQIYYQVLS